MFRTKLILKYLLVIVLSVAGKNCYATQYPVQGTLAINSPYPAYLSDYANPNIEKLILNLTLTDLNISNKRVRLKLFIQKQNSLIARSADNIIGEPAIILDGGVPQRFTSIELAGYFKMENLQGINGGAYNQPLAEGVYNIGFEVYDYFTGNKLSDRISQMFWLMLSDPPLLNMPRNRENIVETNPNNPQIVFQWTPRTTQVTNTEYEFTLSELWDEAGGHYQQFLAAIPKFQTTVANTTLLYGIAEPPLLAGRTYAWRIRAKAKAGFEDIGMYRQDGYSEIFVFTYGGQCAAVQGVNIEVKGYDRMYISWQPNPNQNLYKVAYRKYTPGNNWEWREVETFTPYLNLFGLEANTAYEIKVGGICNDGLVSYSTPQTNKTLQNGQISGINCGQAPVIDIANQDLLQHLSANQVVMAGDFPITITRVEGGSGVYSGEGWVKVPWLADTKIKVTYTGIKVNTDYKLIDGFFETTYDPEGKNIGDVDEFIHDINEILSEIAGSLNANNPIAFQNTLDSLQIAILNQPGLANVSAQIQNKLDEVKALVNSVPVNSPGNVDSVNTLINQITGILNSHGSTVASRSGNTANKKCFYRINGNKFFNNDTIFLPKKNKSFTFKAYMDSVNLCKNGSTWNGMSLVSDSATAIFNTNTVSTSISGTVISTIFSIDSTHKDTLSCRAVVVDVQFTEDITQNGAFDANTISQYPSYDTLNGKPNPWKSTKKGIADKVFAKTNPAIAASKIEFAKSAMITSLTPVKGKTGNDNLSISLSVNDTTSSITAKVSKFLSDDLMKLNIVSYDTLRRTVGIIYVDEENDDIQVIPTGVAVDSVQRICIRPGKNKFLDSKISPLDSMGKDRITGDTVIMAGRDKICNTIARNINIVATNIPCPEAQLKDSLNKIYQGANLLFANVSNYPYPTRHLAINFDFDRDGLLDGIGTREMDSLKNRVADTIKRIGDNMHYYLIVVKDAKYSIGNSLLGKGSFDNSPRKFRFVFITSDPHIGKIRRFTNTVSHELGHGGFDLQHPFHQTNIINKGYIQGLDPDNFMDYQDGHKARKYQWNQIHYNDKIKKYGKMY